MNVSEIYSMKTTLLGKPELTDEEMDTLNQLIVENRLKVLHEAKEEYPSDFFRHRFKRRMFSHMVDSDRFFIIFVEMAFEQFYPYTPYVTREKTKEVTMDDWLDGYGEEFGIHTD